MLYFMHLYDRYDKYYIFFFNSFLIVIWCFMVLNATEYCVLNISSFKVFLPAELFIIYPILIWSKLRSLVKIWTKTFYNILNNERELKIAYQENFLTEKKSQLFFCFLFFPLPWGFPVSVW